MKKINTLHGSLFTMDWSASWSGYFDLDPRVKGQNKRFIKID